MSYEKRGAKSQDGNRKMMWSYCPEDGILETRYIGTAEEFKKFQMEAASITAEDWTKKYMRSNASH